MTLTIVDTKNGLLSFLVQCTMAEPEAVSKVRSDLIDYELVTSGSEVVARTVNIGNFDGKLSYHN